MSSLAFINVYMNQNFYGPHIKVSKNEKYILEYPKFDNWERVSIRNELWFIDIFISSK